VEAGTFKREWAQRWIARPPHADAANDLARAWGRCDAQVPAGVILETWDDWTEGSFFEPSISEGTSKIDQLQARLGDLYGEPAVSRAAQDERWVAYGQPHGGLKPAPHTPLCSDRTH
jgi:hypothetical protein